MGLAISDASRTLARPLSTIDVTGAANAVERVMKAIDALVADEDGLETIVIGLPTRLDGSATGATPRVQAFVDALRTKDDAADRHGGRAFDESRSRKSSRAQRARLAEAKTEARRGGRRHHPAGLPGPPMKKLLLWLVLIVTGAAVAGGWFYCARRSRTAGTRARSSSWRSRPARAALPSASAWSRAVSSAICRPTG